GRALDFPYKKDEVVLVEPRFVGFLKSGFGPRNSVASDFFCSLRQIASRNPAGRERHQITPLSFEWKIDEDTYDSVIVIFDANLSTGFTRKLCFFKHGGALEKQLLRSCMLQTFSQATSPQD